jgi:hypothetical protein
MPQIKFHHLCLYAALGFCTLAATSRYGYAAGIPGAQASPAASDRVLGSVTATTAASVTVHTASSGDITVSLTPQTRLLRAAPGEKSLKDAAPITPGDLAIGDRVLIRLAAGGDAAHPSADILVAMKQGDIHTTPGTVFRRYAPDSTAFADSKPATLADIHAGDQVRARGPKDESGSTIDADEVVAGSFRDIAGTVLKTDPSANTITLKDLATKKSVTLSLDASTQLRKLPPEMAERLAHSQDRTHEGGTMPHSPGTEGHMGGHMGTPGGSARHGDAADMLAQAPSIPLGDLKKGDAVMVVASGAGAAKPTAITIVSGVEPLLQAPAEASEGVFSASWNLGGGDASAEAAPQR